MVKNYDAFSNLVSKIGECRQAGRTVIAIDGVDGAGKTRFGDKLARFMATRDVQVIRVSVDDFHNPKAIRYRRGKESPIGFFQDSYNYEALLEGLLKPFCSGAPVINTSCFDLEHDVKKHETKAVGLDAILVFDGIFLHRDEIRSYWDWSIFLQVPFEITYARMAQRDGCLSEPHAISNRRYFLGQQIYLRRCQPTKRANVLVDNSDYEQPRILTDISLVGANTKRQ